MQSYNKKTNYQNFRTYFSKKSENIFSFVFCGKIFGKVKNYIITYAGAGAEARVHVYYSLTKNSPISYFKPYFIELIHKGISLYIKDFELKYTALKR